MKTLIEDLLLTLDPVEFAHKYLLDEWKLDDWQKRVLRTDSKRVILNCSRQAGKSTVVSILALHQALFFPGSFVIVISASLRQANELYKKIHDFLWRYREKVPMELSKETAVEMRFPNGSRILSLPSSEATIRGFSAPDLIIEDEAAKVDDEIYYALRPMLATSNGRLFLVSTPFGCRGHFYKEWGNPDFEKFKITAYDVPRISKEFLESEKRSLGDFWFSQEYLCEFTETAATVFRFDNIGDYLSEDAPVHF